MNIEQSPLSASNGNESQKQSKQLPEAGESPEWISSREWRILVDQNSDDDLIRSHPIEAVSIFRVPNFLKKSREREAYVPQIVSLGPYHHKNAQLRPMKKHKRKAFQRMTRRFDSPSCVEEKVGRVKDEMLKLECEIRKSYEEEIGCEAESLTVMLCLDGCFILEILRTLCGDKLPGEEASKCYEPIFERDRITYTGFDILSDILKLENQVPLIVLRKLLQLVFHSNDVEGEILGWLVNCLGNVFYPFVCNVLKWEPQYYNTEAHHLLDLLHSLIVSALYPVDVGDSANQKKPEDMQQSQPLIQSKERPEPPRRIPRAAKLRNAGIKFKACDGDTTNIKFEQKTATIHLPQINITDYTEVLFRNLIALELCKPSETNYVTWYVKLMDELIDKEEDVGVLTQSGIIMNYLGSDIEVAKLFNVLCNGVTLTPIDAFHQMKKQVREHHSSKFKVWSEELAKRHFSSPWKCLALVGAIVGLLLTLLQTIYSIIAYYK